MIQDAVESPALLLRRIRSEYLEMPGLQLTLEQAKRLFALDRSMCLGLLTALEDEGFLTRTATGAFSRTDSRYVRSSACAAC